MFSLESFYRIISKNLLEPLDIENYHFEPFGSTSSSDIKKHFESVYAGNNYTLFYDQEPIYSDCFTKLSFFSIPMIDERPLSYTFNAYGRMTYWQQKFHVLGNSEVSVEKNKLLKAYNLYDWYYFFHGFAALDWFKNVEYLPPIRSYSKLFISFNNLINGKRCYRLEFLANLIDKDLLPAGFVSITQDKTLEKIKKELINPFSPMASETKKLIYKTVIPNISQLIIDKNPRGIYSADDNLEVFCKALFHIVTETVFYDDKLHLTEKIFKPIIARRPFLLLAAPHNLKYLRSYGFRTFEPWIDESYDSELDHEKRIYKVVAELKKLANLSTFELNKMYLEMQQVLDYNYKWFYNGFKKQIVNELIDNFELATKKYNLNKSMFADDYLDTSVIDFETVKRRLTWGSN